MNISAVTYNNYPFRPDNTQSPAIDPAIKAPTTTPALTENQTRPNRQSGPAEKTFQPSGPQHTGQADSRPDGHSDNQSNENPNQSNTTTVNGQALDSQAVRLLDQLQQIDREVRRHEMAHVAAGGRYITSGASFTYKKGPDGRNYAVAGEVGIDTSPVPGDPQATLQKMRQVKSAALAPANPSSQDLKVASQATANASKALSDLMILTAKEQAASNETQAFGNMKEAAGSYEKVSSLPETETSSFQIAV